MRKGITLLLSMTLLINLSGCISKTELNQLQLITAIGLDYAKDGVILHLQVTNPGGIGTSDNTQSPETNALPVYTYSYKAKTILKALREAESNFSRHLFFHNVGYLVIGERFARDTGLEKMTDFFARFYQIRHNFPVFVAKDTTAQKILSLYTAIEANPSTKLEGQAKNTSGSIGLTEWIELEQVLDWQFSKTRQVVSYGVKTREEISEDEEYESSNGNKKTFQLTGLPIFKNAKLVGWYSVRETRAWSFMQNRTEESIWYIAACPKGKGDIGAMLPKVKTKIIPSIQNGQLTYTIHVKGKGILQEITCGYPLSDPATYPKLNQALEKSIEKDMHDTVKRAQKYSSDVLGFGELLYQEMPQEFKKREKQWPKNFKQAKVIVKADIRISSPGSRVKSIHEHNK
ncbi:spore germination protein KC [Bacillus ectoiniformans]|uniref:Ger(x)C family spore germination protein n=1 Tax=Bacillus ectoiniformans TaxID=1494429 RepID=UPI0019572257|nr:Ger(x)C family spore germination protein [Bacillus ectoiniformans]MBM7648633.1 spore germination protein KC [Bacillus ectoiniformans]